MALSVFGGPQNVFIQSFPNWTACRPLTYIAVEALYNGQLGDRTKWPLLRGGRCREVLSKS